MSAAQRSATIATDLGTIRLVASEAGLARVELGADTGTAPDGESDVPLAADPVLAAAARQLGEYLDGARRDFDLPLDRGGLSDFDLAVSDAMRAIPYGRVASYGQLAAAVGRPRAARAIGGACNRNPLPVVVPCHRVVASDGTLGGFALGLEAKRRLLAAEGAPALPGGWGRHDQDAQLRLGLG